MPDVHRFPGHLVHDIRGGGRPVYSSISPPLLGGGKTINPQGRKLGPINQKRGEKRKKKRGKGEKREKGRKGEKRR